MAKTGKIHKRIRLLLVVFWLSAFSWVFYQMQARGFDPLVLESDDFVVVSNTRDTISYWPEKNPSDAGLIFYPGALVDPQAYAPMARQIALKGYPVVIIKVPYRLALTNRQIQEVINRTRSVLSVDSTSTRWVLGGHSRGGKMAVNLVVEHPEWFKGLLLVGTSHPREIDLSNLSLDIVKVYGSEDGLASEAEVKQFATNLPENTTFVRIEGGNHRQFGYYGWQLGDRTALIDRETQIQQTVDAIVNQLENISMNT